MTRDTTFTSPDPLIFNSISSGPQTSIMINRVHSLLDTVVGSWMRQWRTSMASRIGVGENYRYDDLNREEFPPFRPLSMCYCQLASPKYVPRSRFLFVCRLAWPQSRSFRRAVSSRSVQPSQCLRLSSVGTWEEKEQGRLRSEPLPAEWK